MLLRYFILLSAFVFLPLRAHAEDLTMFTTIFYDDEGLVYTAVKQEKENQEALSKVVMFPYPAPGAPVILMLPEEVSSHDVIGLLPEREILYVLTQDYKNPQGNLGLHSYNKKTDSWKSLGKTNCQAFTKIKLSHDRITAFCEVKQKIVRKRKKQRMQTVAHAFRLGKNRIYRTGSIRFPEFLLRYKGVNLLLEGKAPSWEKLHIKTLEDNKSFLASDFFPESAPVAQTNPGTPATTPLEKAQDK